MIDAFTDMLAHITQQFKNECCECTFVSECLLGYNYLVKTQHNYDYLLLRVLYHIGQRKLLISAKIETKAVS